MKRILLALLLISAISCSKQSVTPLKDNLIGIWQLTQFLADPGDGSGTWQKPDSTKVQTISFIGAQYYVNNSLVAKYALKSDSELLLITGSRPDTTSIIYKLSGDSLLIRPLCDEACGYLYIKIPSSLIGG